MFRFITGLILFWFVLLRCAAAEDIPDRTYWRVALIDRFYPGSSLSLEDLNQQRVLYGLLDLDSDDLPEPYYHGDLVQIIAQHPKLIFLRYPITARHGPLEEILLRLQQIRLRFTNYSIDALLLSWESSSLISAFEKPLKPENAKHYKALVRDWGKSSKVWYISWQIIQQLEWLTKQGVQVFTIAGNGGRGMVNTFSFAQGVITVGAIEPELQHFVANNAFVDEYASAAYEPKRLDNLAGEAIGYDLDRDNCVDIPLRQLSNFQPEHTDYSRNPWPILKGSSFAAPAALKAHFIASSAASTDC